MRIVTVLEPARADAAECSSFYEKQEPGAGDYFLAHLDSALVDLAAFPGTHAMRFGLHRMLLPRLPHPIFYREKAHETEVVAIVDLRRDPQWIRRQLRSR